MEAASVVEAKNGKLTNKYISPYTLYSVLQGGGHRVGDVIISTSDENPSIKFGGTWQLLCPGRTLVCINTGDTDFNTVKKTGGHKELQSHYHTGQTTTDGNHNHNNSWDGFSIGSGGSFKYVVISGGSNQGVATSYSGGHSHLFTTSTVGNGNAGNLQPYMTVYMWEKVA